MQGPTTLECRCRRQVRAGSRQYVQEFRVFAAISSNYDSRGPCGHVSLWSTTLDVWLEAGEHGDAQVSIANLLVRDVSRGQSQLHDHLRFRDRWYVSMNDLDSFLGSRNCSLAAKPSAVLLIVF